jgi:hypothetical protein
MSDRQLKSANPGSGGKILPFHPHSNVGHIRDFSRRPAPLPSICVLRHTVLGINNLAVGYHTIV